MGPRTRGGGAPAVAALFLGIVLTAAPSGARPQARPAASASAPRVSNFYLVPWFRADRPGILTRLDVKAVTRGERVLSACSACGTTKFAEKRAVYRVSLLPSSPLRMRATTRVLVGVISKRSTGRWIVMGFHDGQYTGLGHGCMPASVTSLTPAEAARPSTIPPERCGLGSSGTEYVYWTGSGHQLYELQYISPHWGRVEPIGSGNAVGSAPAAVALPSGERDVFWNGTDGALHEMSYIDGFWTSRGALTAKGTLKSAPTAVVDKYGVVHVFYVGALQYIYSMAYRGGVWARAWRMNSGPVGSPPAVVVRQDGSLDLFWKGGGLYEMRGLTGHLAHAVPEARTLGSGPTAAVDSHDTVHVFWQGTKNGRLWELSDPDRRGFGLEQLNSGQLGSAPSAVIHPDGEIDVFWRGTHGGLRELQWYSGHWHLTRPVLGTRALGSQPAVALGK
jgi:hypothetical protein